MDATPAPQTPAEDDDFFSSWDKPASKPATPTTSAPTSPPVIGRSPSAAAAPSAPRTISSSSFRSSSTPASGRPGKLGASRLTSSNSVTGASTGGSGLGAAKKSKLGGLGAKKAVAPIDFAEAERKAKEEAERIKQLGYDKQREEEEENARKEAEKLQAAANAKARPTSVKPANGSKADVPKGNNQDLERLGMGFKKLGFGAIPSGQPAAVARSRCVHHIKNLSAVPNLFSKLINTSG